MNLVVPASTARFASLITGLEGQDVTYTGPPVTSLDAAPPHFHLDRYEAVVGAGAADLARAREGLQSWRAHRIPGIRVYPQGRRVTLGATVVIAVGTRLAAVAAPCRITAVEDRPDGWGFSYATLPGHPERGEESFDVALDGHGRVRFCVAAVSRPEGPVARIGAPVARALQRQVALRYLRALARHVAAGAGGVPT